MSDSSFTTSYKMTESGSIFNLQPIPTTIGDATNRSSSGGDVTSTSNGGTSGGDAVTFYSSSNPDSSYHKLNALMTFVIRLSKQIQKFHAGIQITTLQFTIFKKVFYLILGKVIEK